MSTNDNGPHVVTLPQKPNELAAAGEKLKRDLDILISNQMMVAKLRRAAYLAAIEAGFDEKQALELCCK